MNANVATFSARAAGRPPGDAPVLEIDNLSVAYPSAHGLVQAVSNVSLSVYPNEIVGLVGESGSGKSTMAYAIMRLLKGGATVTGGSVRVLGQDVYRLSPEELRQFRWTKMSMVFQSAMNALNPVLTVEEQIIDTLLSHQPEMSRREARERAVELMRLVRIDPSRLRSYPHELSGGMRQRVVMAIAIALEPSLVIMDEPTTALDVVVQRSILDQIVELKEQKGFSILFISHDFSLVAEMADRVAVMYAGRVVEVTDSGTLTAEHPHHPYTAGLLGAIPRLTAEAVTIEGIPGQPPDLVSLPPGCAFHPRCPHAFEPCLRRRPPLVQVNRSLVECHLYDSTGGERRG